MELTLHYRGRLKANGGPEHKNELRAHFHTQLERLWQQKPLSEMDMLLAPRDGQNYCLLRKVGRFTYVPLVTQEMDVLAELAVTFLRPETPGSIITRGGDMDNRLKTLFDALTMPQPNALPDIPVPTAELLPFYFCLLEDDNLIANIAVRTEQLLETVSDPSIVDVSIFIRTKTTRTTLFNLVFG